MDNIFLSIRKTTVFVSPGHTSLGVCFLNVSDGPRDFIMVDNHKAVNVGGPDRNVESRKVVKPKFTTYCPEAVVRERMS